MWRTEFKHSENGVEEMAHDFGNGIKIVADLRNRMIRHIHGDIVVKEYSADPPISQYTQFLQEVDKECN